MKPHHQLEYAFKNHRVTHVSEVSKGLACDCLCIACGKKLVARKGAIKTHHFAHHVKSECTGATETALHLLAKELITELDYIKLPKYVLYKSRKLKKSPPIFHESKIANGGDVKITQILVEQNLQNFKPDIIIFSGERKLIIEVAVTHLVDKIKLKRIREQRIPAVEIKLKVDDILLTREQLKEKLKSNIELKKWLFHPNQIEAEKEYIRKAREGIRKNIKRASQRFIKTQPSTPIKNTYIASAASNLESDRMIYEFFNRFDRQPTNEEHPKLFDILYGNGSYNKRG